MKRAVVKLGSSVIAPHGVLDKRLISRLIKDILEVERLGYKCIIVSSGAIACGLNVFTYSRKPQDVHSLMAISSLGQIILMDTYNAALKKYKRCCAQLLLTWDDFDNRKRFINIRKTIDKLLSMGVVPIINENDAVSFEEIRLGDNDRISARVADALEAEWLIMLSDVEGLLKGKTLVREVNRIDESIVSLAKKEDKTHTSGGMETKLIAARIATSSGIKTVIAWGRHRQVLSKLICHEKIGTFFPPQPKIASSRKRWIIFSKKVKGTLTIDHGAQEALILKGKSLLAVGVTRQEGDFKNGDSVRIIDVHGRLLGYGITGYDAAQLAQAKGTRGARELIHRDNFVKVCEGWCDV